MPAGAGTLVALARPNRHIAPHVERAERRSSRCTGWATISSCSTRARRALDLTLERRRAIADRRLGVGCDQLIVLEPPTDREADVFMRIYNPDGGEAGACGNATRCVASVLMDERKTDQVTVQTISGLLESQKTGRAPTACR